ncbi:transposase [Lutibacter sp. B2]|nr:transposase [Lutibacter sp. B2]
MISISNNSTKQTIYIYFLQYKTVFHKRSFEIFIWLVSGMLCLEEIRSIKFVYDYFICKYSCCSLNSFYYFLSYLDFSLNDIMNITVRILLNLVPENLKLDTIFLSIDDTLQPKYGHKFDCCAKLFDHAAKDKKNRYIHGHCFVSLVLNIPLKYNDTIKYLSLPIGYRLYDKEANKLHMASNLIKTVMPLLTNYQVILLCDSWYTKGIVLETIKEYDNLDLIGAVRWDTAIYDLPPESTGKRGRPRKKGAKLNIKEFTFVDAGEYGIATKKVMTNLFKKPIYMTATTKDKEDISKVRAFICTINLKNLQIFKHNTVQNVKFDQTQDDQLPLCAYSLRWNIEVIFYQHKFFWSFGNYMLRNKAAIERYSNLVAITFTFVSVLPFINESFSKYQFESPQKIKRTISNTLMQELIFEGFANSLKSTKIYFGVTKAIESFLYGKDVA